MNKIIKSIFVYLAFVVALFSFLDFFVAGAFGYDILRVMTNSVTWYRVVIALIGVVGLWYVIFERFIQSRGNVK